LNRKRSAVVYVKKQMAPVQNAMVEARILEIMLEAEASPRVPQMPRSSAQCAMAIAVTQLVAARVGFRA
jgi:predicted Ser/Thr protein kinase